VRRGPIDHGVVDVTGAWLGHRRLPIIATSSAGHQPTIDKKIGVVLTL